MLECVYSFDGQNYVCLGQLCMDNLLNRADHCAHVSLHQLMSSDPKFNNCMGDI